MKYKEFLSNNKELPKKTTEVVECPVEKIGKKQKHYNLKSTIEKNCNLINVQRLQTSIKSNFIDVPDEIGDEELRGLLFGI